MKKKMTFKPVMKMKETVLKRLQSHKMGRPFVKMLLFLFILFGLVFGYKFIKNVLMPHPTPAAVSVSATHVKYEEWQPKLQALGTLRAIQGVDITTELSGMVTKIHLKAGSQVTSSDLLIELNADSEIAQRDASRALVALAEITYNRDKSQFAIHAISKAILDFDKADLDNKRAQLAQQESIIAKKRIRAPFSGMLGILAVNLGQYLNTGDKIITLQTLDPIYVDFTLPQKTLSSIRIGQKINLKIDTYPDQVFTGEITSIDPKIDQATRNIQIEATVANPYLKLYPGMFGEVNVYINAPQKHLTLPKTAISFNPFGEVVYIIKSGKDKAGKPLLEIKQSFITVGESRGGQTAILMGLKEGDQVVTAGQQKVKNGTIVEINNAIVPSADPAPDLKDE